MEGPFIFRCPANGLNVQHIFDNSTPGGDDDRVYVGVRCLACSGIHLVSRTTWPFGGGQVTDQGVLRRSRHNLNISRRGPGRI